MMKKYIIKKFICYSFIKSFATFNLLSPVHANANPPVEYADIYTR